jgi:hypothetical protein
MLREPVDRAISAFYYHGHTTEEWDTCLFTNGTTHNQCRFKWQYHNDMVRGFAGRGSSIRTWTSYDETLYPQIPVNRTSLQFAKEFLLDMDLVCFQDDLYGCREQLYRRMTKSTSNNHTTLNLTLTSAVPPIGKQNVNSKRPSQMDEIITNKVRVTNWLDVKLYDWAILQDFGSGNL